MMTSWQSDRRFVLSTVALCLSLACSASNSSGNGGKGGTGLGGSSGSSGSSGQNGSGGSVGVGGSVATGGTAGQSGSGGLPGTGGVKGSGGATVSGGATGSGGTTGSGGATSTGSGGATSTGGATRSGGATGSGGTAGAGGTVGSGGATGVGGATGPGGATGAGGGTAVAGAIYVAPDGDDANPGTLAKPLKTVAKARDLVRTKNSAMTADITVYLRGGTYPQTSTLTFANPDSGTGGFYVKYMAYPGERPLMTGGQPIKGWKVSDATNNIYSASAGTMAFRQLYVNGVKAIRARTPNLLASNVANFNRLSGWDKTANNLQVPTSAVATWNNLTKVEMHVNIAWGDSTLRIASITNSGTTALVKFQSPESPMVFVRPNPNMAQVGWGSGRAYYFENALEFLDQAGEWYLDETTSTVYYKPRTGEDMTTATVIAPMVETIMSVNGTSTSSQASYLWFQGLTFAHSTFMRPSQYGFLDGQAGQYNLTADANNNQTVGRMTAGVSVMNANHMHFERNLFTQMGGTGLDFISGTHDDTIIGNAITDIAGNGISVGKFTASDTTEFHVAYNPSDKNEICTRETVKDNYISNVTTEILGGVGIGAGYPANIDIEHNEVSYTNYTGISVGFGWTSTPNAMTNNKINYNNIHHVNQIMTDGGAIYTLSNQGPSSEMQYNYIHDYACSKWADYGCNGLYLDEQTSGYTVAHNVMVNCPTNIAQNKNGTNTITDNSGNPSGAQNTIANAGIEATYADIKTLTVPAATF
jgi:Right handed beta helix region